MMQVREINSAGDCRDALARINGLRELLIQQEPLPDYRSDSRWQEISFLMALVEQYQAQEK